MILWGEIGEFPLFSVLQFLANQRRTGILEIQDFEELGSIYYARGRIEAISMTAWDELLGSRFVAAGAVTESQVKECWMQGGQGDEEWPALACLLAVAKGDYRALMEIVNHHVSDAVMQLMYWNSGTFRFRVPAKPAKFRITPSLEVESLLLDAYRRVDEGERPWRDKMLSETELCLTCTIDCSEEIKARYLKSDVCLWRCMPSVLKDPIYRGMKKRPSPFEEDEMEELPFI
jgi:hypothetical protein